MASKNVEDHKFLFSEILKTKTDTQASSMVLIHFIMKLCKHWQLNPEIMERYFSESCEIINRKALEEEIWEKMKSQYQPKDLPTQDLQKSKSSVSETKL